jgi:hypothetical protein
MDHLGVGRKSTDDYKSVVNRLDVTSLYTDIS